MLIVGELINTSRKAIREAVDKRDTVYIQEIALKQVEAGAAYIDVNCGTSVFNEKETMAWLVETVQAAVEKPLCIDSPSPEALKTGLELVKTAKPMINSITAEKERFNQVLPLVLKYQAKIVALCIDDSGMPETVAQRIEIVKKLVKNLTSAGVPQEDIYLDPLVKPISTGDKAGLEVLETVSFIKKEYPRVHAICGLSNVSYGLPNRKRINRTFMSLNMAIGMDAFILDPLDKEIMGLVYICQALLGQDYFCTSYLKAHRQGLYE